MTTRLLVLVAALALSLGAAQTHQGGHDGYAAPAGAMGALEALSGRAFDVAFMSQMVAHHRAAVTMARLELGAGASLALKAVATDIVLDQEYEIRRLTDWLRGWYGAGPDPAQVALMDAEMAPMLARASAASRPSSGRAAADAAFVEEMIPHHEHAIAMARLAPTRAARPELRAFAEAVIVKQTIEIEQLRRLTQTAL